ncbi:MAG: hypothetical protein WAK16_03550, partial [Candidatus Cybelea sp.]
MAVLALAAPYARVGAAAAVKSGIDLAAIDRSCKPCDDFYRFANGNWIKSTQIPADKSYYGS